MSNSGIVRRIDELGRIVIPKEIRRTMRLNEGDEMEISPQGETLVLRKYSGMESILSITKAVSKLLATATDSDVIFVNTEKVLVAEGKNKKHYIDAPITDKFAKFVRAREVEILHGDDLKDLFLDRECVCSYLVIEPIIACGDLVGCAVLLLDGLPSDIARAYLHFCTELVQSTLSC